ncbi:MAG: tetratricopeptide repeat protein [Sphaerochaeta sp.]|nr:tetratricopeptide repeat protein [Sphaerochaeta sp.]
MSDKSKETVKLTGFQKVEGALNRFLSKYLKAGAVVLIVIVLVLIGLGIGTSVSKKGTQAQFDQIDKLQTSYEELSVLDIDDDAYQASYDSLVADLNALAAKSKRYPGQKATYILGLLAFEREEYQAALDSFKRVYDSAKQTYLGSLSLANAAASAENMGNDTLALEYWTKIIDEYGFTAAESPKALFGQARLQQKSGNIDLAKATFQQLVDQFPTSEFAKLATNSLVVL